MSIKFCVRKVLLIVLSELNISICSQVELKDFIADPYLIFINSAFKNDMLNAYEMSLVTVFPAYGMTQLCCNIPLV